MKYLLQRRVEKSFFRFVLVKLYAINLFSLLQKTVGFAGVEPTLSSDKHPPMSRENACPS